MRKCTCKEGKLSWKKRLITFTKILEKERRTTKTKKRRKRDQK